ncbi:hypothetical protein DITRI_Ditri08aG0011800 [Diplodiscus trichospermus]
MPPKTKRINELPNPTREETSRRQTRNEREICGNNVAGGQGLAKDVHSHRNEAQGSSTETKNFTKEFVKLVKPFDGTSIDPLDAEKWIKEIEKAFKAQGVTEEKRISFATFLLQGVLLQGVLFEQYASADTAFYALQKGSMTVIEYERELNRLMKFAPNASKNDEEARIQR